MLRAFVEVDRTTMGPERLAAKLGSYARLYHYVSAPVPGRRQRQAFQEPWQGREEWRRHRPLLSRLLFVLDGTGPAGITTRFNALRAAAEDPAFTGFLRDVPVLAAPLIDVLESGPAEPVWHPRPGPGQHRQLEPLTGPGNPPSSPCPPWYIGALAPAGHCRLLVAEDLWPGEHRRLAWSMGNRAVLKGVDADACPVCGQDSG